MYGVKAWGHRRWIHGVSNVTLTPFYDTVVYPGRGGAADGPSELPTCLEGQRAKIQREGESSKIAKFKTM